MGSARVSLEPPAPPGPRTDLFRLGSDAASYGILAALIVLAAAAAAALVLWYRKAFAIEWDIADLALVEYRWVTTRTFRPLLSRSTTEEFDSPPNHSRMISTARTLRPLLSRSTTGEFDSRPCYSRWYRKAFPATTKRESFLGVASVSDSADAGDRPGRSPLPVRSRPSTPGSSLPSTPARGAPLLLKAWEDGNSPSTPENSTPVGDNSPPTGAE
eukprot:4910333-Pyramimonas_sp.AAC.1